MQMLEEIRDTGETLARCNWPAKDLAVHCEAIRGQAPPGVARFALTEMLYSPLSFPPYLPVSKLCARSDVENITPCFCIFFPPRNARLWKIAVVQKLCKPSIRNHSILGGSFPRYHRVPESISNTYRMGYYSICSKMTPCVALKLNRYRFFLEAAILLRSSRLRRIFCFEIIQCPYIRRGPAVFKLAEIAFYLFPFYLAAFFFSISVIIAGLNSFPLFSFIRSPQAWGQRSRRSGFHVPHFGIF